jgi:hypothetical protein
VQLLQQTAYACRLLLESCMQAGAT